MVAVFFALSFAARSESAQTSRKKARPTPTPAGKNAKATPAPTKKTPAKATPTPKKSLSSAQTKSAEKTKPAKPSAEDTAKNKTGKGKTSKEAKQTVSKASKNSRSSKSDKKTNSKQTTNAKKSASKTKTTAEKTVPASKNFLTKSNSVKTSAKTTEKVPSKATEKTPGAAPQIIVTDVAARIRSQAKAGASELDRPALGTVFQVVEKTPAWYRVKFTDGGKTSSGWIPANSASDLNASSKVQLYQQITERYYKPSGMDFATASGLYEFLNRAAGSGELGDTGELELKRLLALRAALRAMPRGNSSENPYKSFLKTNEKNVVYSEPSGEWIVKSDQFWDLHKKYKNAAIADQIAWEAAQNPLPGECEGYVNCHLFYTRMTSGEYLSLHPGGKKNLEALTNLTNSLEPIAADLPAKSVYTGPTDVTDRAEFNNLIAELRTIISRVPLTEKEKPLQQLKKIAEAFR